MLLPLLLGMGRRSCVVSPFAYLNLPLDMLQIELTEGILELVLDIRFSEGGVGRNELALLQGGDILGQRPAGRDSALFDQFVPCLSAPFPRKGDDEAFQFIRAGELGGEQPLEFFFQRRILVIEDGVDVLGDAETFPELVQVERYSAEGHVSLADVVFVILEPLMKEELPAFIQGKRGYVQGKRNPPIQSSLVVDKLVQDPGGGASADDQLDILPCQAPVVAEMLESGHETGFRGVHPRQFVYEDDLPLPVILFLQEFLEHMKRFGPVLRRAYGAVKPEGFHRKEELLELDSHQALFPLVVLIHGRHGGVLEAETVSEEFIYEKRLSDPSPPVHSDKLRPVFVDGEVQFLDFIFPSNHRISIFSHKYIKRFLFGQI